MEMNGGMLRKEAVSNNRGLIKKLIFSLKITDQALPFQIARPPATWLLKNVGRESNISESLRFEEICKNSAFFGLRSLFQQSKGLQQ
jgi:hypothetical protein